MPGNIIGLMALTSVSIIMFLCVVFSFLYDKTKEKNKLIKTAPEDDWLFSCFHESVYDLMYKKPPHDTMIDVTIINRINFTFFIYISFLMIIPYYI